MPCRHFIVLLISVLPWVPAPVNAIDNARQGENPAQLCDRFASFEDIPERGIQKAYFGFIDVEKSLKPCLAAHDADPANTRVQAQLARIYFQQGKFIQGLALAHLSVKDQSIAYVLLAYAYRKGVGGVGIDLPKSAQLLESGVSHGVPDAMNDLSGHYAIGLGVVKDEQRALDLLQRAVDAGDLWAKYLLGTSYSVGRLGLNIDHDKAIQLLQESAENGLPIAQYRLSMLITNLERRVTPGAIRYLLTSRVLFEKYARQGSASASYYLGEMYQRGIAVRKDTKKAFDLYRLAAGRRHVSAMSRLGTAYVDGVDVDKNPAEGKKLLEMAARLGSSAAEKKLGEMGRIDSDTNVRDDTVVEGPVVHKPQSVPVSQDPAKGSEDEAIDPVSRSISDRTKSDAAAREVGKVVEEPKAEAPRSISDSQDPAKGLEDEEIDSVSRFLGGRFYDDDTERDVGKVVDEPKAEAPRSISDSQDPAKGTEDEEIDPITRFMGGIFQGDDTEHEVDKVVDESNAEMPRRISGSENPAKGPEDEEIDPITRFFGNIFDGEYIDDINE